MPDQTRRPAAISLVVFAVLTTVATWVLISIGGLVTSKGVGMAVPDWPTTYGYNMFLFPIDQWTGGIFHEHLHRLVASGVGFLTLLLALLVQAWGPGRGARIAAWSAFVLVCVQGVLGGKRVLLNSVDVAGIPGSLFFGMIHATTAQLFFCLVGLITLGLWLSRRSLKPGGFPDGAFRWAAILFGLTLVQLIVAAAMRHQHAGLAIPDFPLAYGKIYPPTDAEFLRQVNIRRVDYLHDEPVTAFQVHLQMVHRILAVALVALVLRVATGWVRWGGIAGRIGKVWAILILVQFGLGAATIWSRKAADVATAHVATGALLLLTTAAGAFLAFAARRQETAKVAPCPEEPESLKARRARTAASAA